MKNILSLVVLIVSAIASSVSQTYRMVARASSNYSEASQKFEPVDSAHYDWAAGHGGYNFLSVYHSSVAADHMDTWSFSGNNPVSDERASRNFDQNGNLLTTEYELWQVNGSYWKKGYKSVYSYDGQNRMTEYIGMEPNQNNTGYQNKTRTVYTYDINGNLVKTLGQSWLNNAWADKTQTLCSYNGSNAMTSKIISQYDGNSWINQDKYGYTLNAGNYVTLEQHFDWNNGWKADGQHLFTYDGNNNLTEDLFQTWVNNAWINDSKKLTTYNSNHQPLSWIYQAWESNTWKNYYRNLYTYDLSGNQLSINVQNWTGNSWIPGNKMSRKYNSNNLCTEFRREYWNGNAFVLTNASERYDYYYEQYTPANVAESTFEGSLSLYPVPASQVLHIAARSGEPGELTIKILDITGHPVLQWTEYAAIRLQKSVPVDHLPNGNYVVVISGRSGKLAQQFSIFH